MLRGLRHRVTYANVVSTLALFTAAPPVQRTGGLCPTGTFGVQTGTLTVSGSVVNFALANESFFFVVP
jgi:hypothetical protein